MRVGVLESFSTNSEVNEWHDTPESSSSWECRVRADGWNASDEGVEVLLCGNEATSSGNGAVAGPQLSDDLIGLSKLYNGLERCSHIRSIFILPHGLAAAKRNWMDPPERVAAWPELPRSLKAPMAAIAPLPCS